MKFRSVSPTALLTAGLCTSRWYAENVIGGRGFSSSAADLGTVCHSALEWFVKTAVINGSHPHTEQTLLDFYQMYYLKIFKDHEFELPQYQDGVAMMRTWFKRNKAPWEFEVVSLESKRTVQVSTSAGEVPCNFIIDRLDRIDETTMRVVDYKSWQKKLYPEDVKRTTQARIYAVATKILYPDIKRVHVVYDQLRYTEVGVYFNERDLAECWRWLQGRVKYLLALEDEDIKETINPECGFCVKKNNCGSFRKHKEAGGIHGLTDEEILVRAVELKSASSMIASALTEIEQLLQARVDADEDSELYHTTEDGAELEARMKPHYTSFVIEEDVRALVGDSVYFEYARIGTAGHKKMLNDERLSPEQVVSLKELRKRTAKQMSLDFKEKKG